MKSTELKKLREQSGMSSSELAIVMDVNRSTIQRYENGSRKIPLEFANKLKQLIEDAKYPADTEVERVERTEPIRTKFLAHAQGLSDARYKLGCERTAMNNIGKLEARVLVGQLEQAEILIDDVIAKLHVMHEETMGYMEGQ